MATERAKLTDQAYYTNPYSTDVEAGRNQQQNYRYDASISAATKSIIWSAVAFLCGVGILLTIILIPISIRTVEYDEYAIRYDAFTKTIHTTVYTEGKYLLTPQTQMFKFSNLVKKMEIDIMCLTLNGIEVKLDVDVEYQLPSYSVYNAFKNYGEASNIEKHLRLVMTDSIRDTCGEYEAKDYYEDRLLIQNTLESTLIDDVSTASAYYNITSAVLASYSFPNELSDSIRDKRAAENEIAIAENERDGLLVEANTVLLTAMIEADKAAIEAQAEVDSVLVEANAQSSAIQSIWVNRQSVYDHIMYKLNITVDRFVFQYLTSVILLNADEPITSL